MQNVTAKLLSLVSGMEHITPMLHNLPWLPPASLVDSDIVSSCRLTDVFQLESEQFTGGSVG